MWKCAEESRVVLLSWKARLIVRPRVVLMRSWSTFVAMPRIDIGVHKFRSSSQINLRTPSSTAVINPWREMDFKCSNISLWKEALSSYESRMSSMNDKKPNLASLDTFYRVELPALVHARDPNPYITRSELTSLMKWKLSRGKFRPRLLDFVSKLDEEVVKSASEKAFLSLPDLSSAVSELTVLKGIGPATASAVLAAYAPDVAPFMSDEAMEAVLGNSKVYSLKQYLVLADRLQMKAKELSSEDEIFTPSDVERALWSCAVGAKLSNELSTEKSDDGSKSTSRRKRKKSS
ncbi:hypothetical protein AKJ16_DCAP09200 [Drosera capensis]